MKPDRRPHRDADQWVFPPLKSGGLIEAELVDPVLADVDQQDFRR